MKERAARSLYLKELGGALLLYAAVLFAALTWANDVSPRFTRTALLLTPMAPVALTVWVIARQFRRLDEYLKLQSLESIAIAAAVTAGWTLTYGFLEAAGFPRLSMFTVWPVMGAVWGTLACARHFRRG